ncbi:MAG: hypothetical protein AAGA87_04625 [Pseudomonadota bacterium]
MTYDAFSAAIGLLGVAFYLGAYALLQMGVLSVERSGYALLNIAAAACVLFELQRNFNLPSVLIQVAWITISVAGLVRIYRAGRVPAPEPEYFPEVRLLRSHNYLESVYEDASGVRGREPVD